MQSVPSRPMSYFPSRFTEWFGPSAWKFMHSVAFTFPNDAEEGLRNQYKSFFESIGHILPCPGCSVHFRQYMEKHPVDVSSREALARWVYDVHCDVNTRSRKPSPTYEEVEKAYAGGISEAQQAAYSAMTPSMQRQYMGTPFVVEPKNASINISDLLLPAGLVCLAVFGGYIYYQERKRNISAKVD